METISNTIVWFGDFICGYPLFILLIGGGLFLFCYSRALPIRHLGDAYRSLHVQKAGENKSAPSKPL